MDKREKYIMQKLKQAEEDGVVCVCKQVTERRIRKTVRNGFRRFTSVKRQTEAAQALLAPSYQCEIPRSAARPACCEYAR